jgi:aryl-alcohol dehydrogenase-like predicted oxidoreductase
MAVFLNSRKTAMRYNNLGASGLMVSELSLGCMTFAVESATGSAGKGVPVEEAYSMMEVAYAHGVNFFDNAEAYGGGGVSERVMGEAIQLGMERGATRTVSRGPSKSLAWRFGPA